MKSQRYLFLAVIAVGVGVCWAEQPVSEPSIVPTIRKACKSIDERLVQWKTIKGEPVCLGHSCDQMTIHAEISGRIRKIEQLADVAGPANSSSFGRTEYLYYLDENEVPIYHYSKNITSKQRGGVGLVSESRYYFDKGQVVAYQKDNTWISPDDPNWPIETGNKRQFINEQLIQARHQISNVKLYYAD